MSEQPNPYDEIVKSCIEIILGQPQHPLLVAVTGESGSGKSYFTKLLEAEFRRRSIAFSFLNHDDFLIPRAKRESLRSNVYADGPFKGKSEWDILENWYFLDDFREVLEKLKSGQAVSYYPYVHDTGEISDQKKTIEPKPIILLENKLFLDEMDLVIELRVDRETIIHRKIERDSDVRTPEQTIEMHERAQGFYWDRQRPSRPHIVIDNNDFTHPIVIET